MALFGQFTERAQHMLEAARSIAEELNNPAMGTEHLLLALVNEDEHQPQSIQEKVSYDDVLALMPPTDENAPKPLQIGMTPRMKKLLELSVIESRRLGQAYVSVEHLWLALLRENDCLAFNILKQLQVDTEKTRDEIVRQLRMERSGGSEEPEERQTPKAKGKKAETPVLAQYSRDLTAAARDNELDPVIGRDTEIQRIIQILIRRTKNNPVLIGEPGVGKSAVVEGLAQRIVQGSIPEMLVGKRVLSLDMG